jgi:hypothetical protein
MVAVVLTVQAAVAGRGWCRTDPVVLLDGEVADIWVASTVEAFTAVTGPTRIVVTVPVGTSTTLVLSDLGFGRGYDVSFAESAALARSAAALPAWIAVFVPADADLPVLVEFVPRIVGILAPASAEGSTNAWVTLETTL